MIVMGGEILILNLAFLCSYIYSNNGWEILYPKYFLLLVFGNISFFLLALILDAYQFPRRGNKRDAVFKIWKVLLLFILLIEAGLNISGIAFFRPFLLTFYISLAVALPLLWQFFTR